ncbi:MAG TPA: 50S ribosomal protein L4 [Candidatus Saccharimonadales bacterium]|nr:50S ribosomal protein L4 [Candidatus Saccharimonadales bacterium]
MVTEKVKKVVKKPATVKTTKPEAKVVKAAPEAKIEKVEESLTVSLYDAAGKETGTVTLPESVFGAKINKVLMAQAVRIFLVNQRQGAANTKSRGQVDGSTRKVWRQKGTGRARHGGIRAPLFVGGGVAHGPKTKDYDLSLPTKMKRAAVLSALASMVNDGKIKVVAGLDKTDGKTKTVAAAFEAMGLKGKRTLLVMPGNVEKVWKAARNVARLEVRPVALLNTYEVLNSGTMVIMQEALTNMETTFVTSPKEESKK